MEINISKSRLIKARKVVNLTPIELKLLLALANEKFNTYDELRNFAYKNPKVGNQAIKDKVTQIRDKLYLKIAINNFGCRMRNKISIR